MKKVKRATTELLARTENLRRITVKALADEMGEFALLEQQLHKLPKTKAFIKGVKESDAEFRKRRIQCVIVRMQEKGEPISLWKVKREAGIKEKYIDELKKLLKY